MDFSTIVKENTRIQKMSLNNLFDMVTLLQNQTERTCGYWNYQMGLNKKMERAVDHFWSTVKRRRLDTRKLTNDCLATMEAYFLELTSNSGK